VRRFPHSTIYPRFTGERRCPDFFWIPAFAGKTLLVKLALAEMLAGIGGEWHPHGMD
jgi:hypothetical protein